MMPFGKEAFNGLFDGDIDLKTVSLFDVDNDYYADSEPEKVENRTSIMVKQSDELNPIDKLSVEEKRKQITNRGLPGLRNLGNTCYMNSILQCLSHTVMLCAWLRDNKFMKYLQMNKLEELATKIRKEKGLSDQDPVDVKKKDLTAEVEKSISYQLARVFQAMWECNWVVVPTTFKDLIGKINPEFKGYTQNDSQELLNLILDRIHEETKVEVEIRFRHVPPDVSALIKKRTENATLIKEASSLKEKEEICKEYREYIQQNPRAKTCLGAFMYWKKYIKREKKSIITDLFTGLYYSRIVCSKCHNETSQFEPFTIMSIPTKSTGETTLEECLAKFSEEETMDGSDMYFCEECDEKVKATKKMFIWEPPEVLIIQLKRFKNEYRNNYSWQTKTNSTVKFPLRDLELTENLPDLYDRKQCVYDLFAISEHFGTCHSGHYKAHCKNAINNKWYEFDDSYVVHVPDEDIEGEIVTKNAYILFYVRRPSDEQGTIDPKKVAEVEK